MTKIAQFPSSEDIDVVEQLIRGDIKSADAAESTGHSEELLRSLAARFIQAGRRAITATPPRQGRQVLTMATPTRVVGHGEVLDAWLGPRRNRSLAEHLAKPPNDELSVVMDWLMELARHDHDALMAWHCLCAALDGFVAVAQHHRGAACDLRHRALLRQLYSVARFYREARDDDENELRREHLKQESRRTGAKYRHGLTREFGEKLKGLIVRRSPEAGDNIPSCATVHDGAERSRGLDLASAERDDGWRGFAASPGDDDDSANALAERIFELAGECFAHARTRDLTLEFAGVIAEKLLRKKSPTEPPRASVLIAAAMGLQEEIVDPENPDKAILDDLTRAVFRKGRKRSRKAAAASDN